MLGRSGETAKSRCNAPADPAVFLLQAGIRARVKMNAEMRRSWREVVNRSFL
jgi:hypothetical protein